MEISDEGVVILSEGKTDEPLRRLASYRKDGEQQWRGVSSKNTGFQEMHHRTLAESLAEYNLTNIDKNVLIEKAAKIGYLPL